MKISAEDEGNGGERSNGRNSKKKRSFFSPCVFFSFFSFFPCYTQSMSDPKSVLVSNIPHDATETQLVEVFKTIGQVEEFRFFFNRDSGLPTGHGQCVYTTAEHASEAMKKMNGCMFRDHVLMVSPYTVLKTHSVRVLPIEKKRPREESENGGGEEMELKFFRLSPHARAPIRSSLRAAGYDITSAHDYVLPAKGKVIVKSDLAIAIPSGHYGRMSPRSSMAWKNHIDVGAGVIDEDYRGNVGVVLFNHSDKDFEIAQGDRVAQLIIERISTPSVREVSTIEELGETERGDGGFGSTGK